MSRLLFALVVTALLAILPAHADEFWVDAAGGDDANSGGAPDDAWRTLSHALPSMPHGQGHTLHVAPGLYEQAHGETFPITVWPGLTIVGDQGRDVTIVDGDGASALFTLTGEFFVAYADETLFEGLHLDDAVRGLDGMSLGSNASCAVRLRDCTMTFMTEAGVRARVTNSFFDNDTLELRVDLVRVLVENCNAGVFVEADSSDFGFADAIVSAGASEFRDNGTCLEANTLHPLEAIAFVSAGHCRFFDNGTGVGAPYAGVSDSLFVGNGAGVGVGEGGGVHRCTFVNNGTGVSGPGPWNMELTHCVLYGNTDDVSGADNIDASWNLVGDGDFQGTNGNISGDPLFVDPAAGDYRLSFLSPAVDAGDPNASSDSKDLAGMPRVTDGDLDTEERIDMGVFEHAPLFPQGTPSLGDSVDLELWGPPGGRSIVYWMRGAANGPPMQTPFGEFDLEGHAVFAWSRIAPGPPMLLEVRIPDVPALVGLTFGLQALSSSTVSSPPGAYTNPIWLTIVE